MSSQSLILCPVDFSNASAGALRYAALVAAHFKARVVALAVEDALNTEALDLGAGILWDPELCKSELARFVAKIFDDDSAARESVECECVVGKPAPEILRVAAERSCELIVMSSHGLHRSAQAVFRIDDRTGLARDDDACARHTAGRPGPIHVEDARRLVRRILVPVDLTPASLGQVKIAASIAAGLDLPSILGYVIEPIRTPLTARLHLAGIQTDSRAVAEDRLRELLTVFPERLQPEALLAYGDPAEELAKVASDRNVGLIVVGLHGSPLFGPRMGSVTYRILCLTKTLVLAVPPRFNDVLDREARTAATTSAASTQSAN